LEEKKREEERARRLQQQDSQQRELDEIKQVYLGAPKEKKKVTKPADKFKFLFDWEPVRCTVKSHCTSPLLTQYPSLFLSLLPRRIRTPLAMLCSRRLAVTARRRCCLGGGCSQG